MAGRFVVFEGIDGCGKQTQITMLAKLLIEKDIKFALFKFPTENAGKIHEYLEGKEAADSATLLEWYAADIQNSQPDIEEAVASGWAVSDRYVISTASYQGTGGKLEETARKLDEMTWISPDVVIWLDIPVDEAMKRKKIQKTPDRHERDSEFLEEVSKNYGMLHQMRFLTPNWHKVDASGKPGDVFSQVRQALGL